MTDANAMRARAGVVSLLLVAFGTPAVLAAQPAMVANVKVLSDPVRDVSSLEAWRASWIRPEMSDKDKALAIWECMVAHQYQDAPPLEFLNHENVVQDALKMMNVYGYSFCGVAANEIASLARYVGLKARISTINTHVVPEVWWDDGWHMLDASLINFFVVKDQPADAINGRFSKALSNYAVPNGRIASVEEVLAAVKGWYDQNPGYRDPAAKEGAMPRGNDARLRAFHQEGGWQGWKRGPKLLADCPFYSDDGWLPAHTHGWYSTMQEYDGSTYFPYEGGYSMGYKVNLQLRPGEKLVRDWSNRGLHVNLDGAGEAPGCLNARIGEGPLAYAPRFGDLAPGRIGNGRLEYRVPLGDPMLEQTAMRYENLQADPGTKPVLQPRDPSRQGILELRLPCSYVYLKGEVVVDAVVAEGGAVGVFLSDNNGLDWQEIGRIAVSGAARFDLGKQILRRYDYRLRLLPKGKGTGLNNLFIGNDIQHSQRALPALAQGENRIAFSVGPQEGTVTVEGSCFPADNRGLNLTWKDFHPEVKGLSENGLVCQGEIGEISYRIETPAPMVGLTVFTHYRARSAKGQWDVQVSFDSGQTFRSVGTCLGPTVFSGVFLQVTDIPPGTRSALVRWQGTAGGNALMLFNQRLDADYALPNAGFRPVKVTYLWEEGGIGKADVHVAAVPAETYTIRCESQPTMRSIVLELAD